MDEPDEGADDIKEWLREIAATDPFEQLKRYRADHPDQSIPEELEFAALMTPIVNEVEGRYTYEDEFGANTKCPSGDFMSRTNRLAGDPS